MTSDLATAQAFFEACETGKGWEGCRAYCTPDASFSAQTGALAEVRTLAAYADWMKGIHGVLTDGRYELHGFAEDATRGVVVAFATFIGTHLAGGPVPPTGRTTRTHYVYAMTLRGGKITHMTKVWNDGYALKELGWADRHDLGFRPRVDSPLRWRESPGGRKRDYRGMNDTMLATAQASGAREEAAGPDPAALAAIAAIEAEAVRTETPCGEGSMVWRSWGEGPPLVLFHGGSGSWLHWIRNIRPLVAAGRRVICPDLPGLGESAMPPPAEDPYPIAAVVRAGLTQLLGEGVRYDLAGFSFGAMLSGHLAAKAGPELASVTLVGAAAMGLPRPRTELMKVRDKDGAARMAAHRHNLEVLMFADARNVDPMALAIQEYNTQHARFRSRGFAGTAALRDAVAHARCPVALIYGERDAIAWPEVDARFVALRSVQPMAWTGVVPGAGHWVAYEAAATLNAMLLDMLGRRRG